MSLWARVRCALEGGGVPPSSGEGATADAELASANVATERIVAAAGAERERAASVQQRIEADTERLRRKRRDLITDTLLAARDRAEEGAP